MTKSDGTTSKRPRSRRRRLAVLILVELLAVLVLSEIALRVLEGRNVAANRMLYMPGTRTAFDDFDTLPELFGASILGFSPFVPRGDHPLNSRSLRTKEYTTEKPSGTFRVLAFGDSFTFASGGVPYETLWHRVMERRLAERMTADVEVLSLSAPAIGTDFQYRLWQLEGKKLDADLVIVAFFVGNDFQDVGGALGDASLVDKLARRSLVVRLFRNLPRLSRAMPAQPEVHLADRAPGVQPGYAYDPMVPTFGEQEFANIEANRTFVCDTKQTDRFERCLQKVEEILVAFSRDTTAAGIPISVMIIPDEFQIDPEVLAGALATRDREEAALDLDRPQRALQALCEKHAIPCLDLLPELRSREERLYRLRNTHWNERGNALAGERMADFLAREGLVPIDE